MNNNNDLINIVQDTNYLLVRVNTQDEHEALDFLTIYLQDKFGANFVEEFKYKTLNEITVKHPICVQNKLLHTANENDSLNKTILYSNFIYEKYFQKVNSLFFINEWEKGLPLKSNSNLLFVSRSAETLFRNKVEDINLKTDVGFSLGWYDVKKVKVKLKLIKIRTKDKNKYYALYRNNTEIFYSKSKKEVLKKLKIESESDLNIDNVYYIETRMRNSSYIPIESYSQTITKYSAKVKPVYIKEKSSKNTKLSGWLFYVPL